MRTTPHLTRPNISAHRRGMAVLRREKHGRRMRVVCLVRVLAGCVRSQQHRGLVTSIDV